MKSKKKGKEKEAGNDEVFINIVSGYVCRTKTDASRYWHGGGEFVLDFYGFCEYTAYDENFFSFMRVR